MSERTNDTKRRPVVVWRFIDGKPGHEKQSAGLLQALQTRAPLEIYQFDVRFNTVLRRQLRGHALHARTDIPNPDLIVGVGHRTHLLMLLTKLICGGKIVVLMKPSLPHRLFDLMFVPQHDRYWRKGNLVETRGVICPSLASANTDDGGLILLGGESKHFEWDNADIAAQIKQIAMMSKDVHWRVCDSRRTPPGLRDHLRDLANVEFTPWQNTSADFLEQALAQTRYVWVTADSVSMLYEALSSQAMVGVIVLTVKRERPNKLVRGINLLKSQGHIYLTSDGYRLNESLAPPHFCNENQRCAQIVNQRLIAS